MHEQNGRKAFKSGVWYILGNFLVKGIGFLTTPIFTRLMTQEDVGDFSNLLTWVGVLAILFTFDLYSSVSVARFDYKNELNEYIASNLLLSTGMTFFFFLFLFPFRDYVFTLMNIPNYTFYIMFVYMITYPAIQMFQVRSQFEYKYKSSLAISISCAIGSSFFSVLLVTLMNNKLMGRTIGYFIPFIVIGAGIYFLLVSKARHINVKYWKYTLSISFPLVFHLLAGYILSSSDRIMIREIEGSKAIGLYSVAYSCAMIVSILMTSLNSAWVPWSMSLIDNEESDKLRSTSRLFILAFCFLVCGIILLGPEILLIMGGKSYMEAVAVIPPVMVGFVFQFIYSLYVNIEQYYKKQIMVAIGTVIAASVNIILNMILIPVYGYVAAAYTTLLSYIVLFVIHFLNVKRLDKLNFYDNKFVFAVLFFALLLLPVASLLYIYNFFRYLVILVFACFLIFAGIKYKEKVLLAIKTWSLRPIIGILINQ